MRLTNCCMYLHAASFVQKARAVTGAVANVGQLAVPELQEWLFWEEEARWFPYDRIWREWNSQPWLILQTSGPTGEVVTSYTLTTTCDRSDGALN